jgi:hypothetical protein
MQEKKLAPVPNTELTLPEMLRLAKMNFKDWRELTFEANTAGSRIFDTVAAAFHSITDAGSREAVNGAVCEFAVWCEKFDQQLAAERTIAPAASAPVGAIARETLEQEIARLKSYVLQVNQLMEPLQTEKMDLEDTHQQDAERPKYEALKAALGRLATLVVPVQDRITKLEHYQRSLLVVERGLPADLLDQPLPSVPAQETLTKELEPVQPRREAIPVAAREVSKEASSCVQSFNELANKLGFLPIEVMVYSLFDLFGDGNQMIAGAKKNRGLLRTLQTAVDVGMLQRYGWDDAKAALKGTTWQGKEHGGYLKFCGMPPNGSPTYTRTERPLPWNSRTLFDEAAVEQFKERMSAPSARS